MQYVCPTTHLSVWNCDKFKRFTDRQIERQKDMQIDRKTDEIFIRTDKYTDIYTLI